MTARIHWMLTGLLGAGLLLEAAVAGIDAGQAQRVAERFLARQGREFRPAAAVQPVGGLFHLIRLETGYVVVSADTRLPPVPAWSATAGFGALDAASNPLLALLEADLAGRLEHQAALSAEQRAARHQAWEEWLGSAPVRSGSREEVFPPEGSTSTGGWVETQWGQGPPWNDDCPRSGTGQRGLAGCPAVTMGQILAYHRNPGEGGFGAADRYHHSYAGNSYWIDDDWEARGFPSFPQLNERLDSLAAHWAAGAEADAGEQAALIFACGTAARQVYHHQGSGTFGVDQAYSGWQRLGCSGARLLDADDHDPYGALSENMRSGLPAHLAVVTPAWDAGHNLVVDGWNGDGYFHLNFGWEGAYDGWYLLPQELPFSLTVLEGMIVDIQPPLSALAPRERPGAGLELAAWPNPGNPRIRLACRLETAARARLEVFDLGGRRVALLHDGPLPAGASQLDWIPTAASGLYLARLSLPGSGAAVSTRLLLLR
ncbi:MAG: C10 family peptidase [Candidatus Delongbacteria bacterium]